MHPKDTQVGIYLWDLTLLDWRKVTLADLQEALSGGPIYKQRIYYNAQNYPEYVGYALPGVSEASRGWKIIKYTYSGVTDRVTNVEFAGGNSSFGYIMNNYAGYTYS